MEQQEMHIGIIGVGNIGGNIAHQLAHAGHQVTVSFAHDQTRLRALADQLGATAAQPGDAAQADVVVLSVPWAVIDQALAQIGPLGGRIVVDPTNQFASGRMADLGGQTAGRHNANRMPGAHSTKCFNTLTAAFQGATATRSGEERVVQWLAGDQAVAKQVVGRLVADAGYVPVDLGGIDDCQVMEAPRRPGAVYGEEYRAADPDGCFRPVPSCRGGLPC